MLLQMGDFNFHDFATSLTPNQHRSKRWLVETLVKHGHLYPKQPRILILGGWYGSFLVPMIKDVINPKTIVFNDLDPDILEFARVLHHDDNISYECFDVEDSTEYINQLDVDMLINTSCEHMFDMKNVVTGSDKTLYVLQSCDNDDDPGHINTVKTTQQFVEQSGLTKVYERSRLSLGHKSRFILFGTKRGIIKQK